jgi:hypothetical protein
LGGAVRRMAIQGQPWKKSLQDPSRRKSWAQCPVPVIPATWEASVGGSWFKSIFHPVQKSTLNRSKVFNVRPQTLELLQEKVENILEDTSTGNYFMNRTPVFQEIEQDLTNGTTSNLKGL